MPNSPFKTFNDMIEFARANPGKLTYGTPGAGTSLHIGMEQIALKAGVKWTQVPFKGGPEILGRAGRRARDGGGRGRRLVAARRRRQGARPQPLDGAAQRAPARYADAEGTGLPVRVRFPFGLAGPKGMDPAIVKKLHDAFKVAMTDPKAMEIQKRYDYATRYMNGADYTKFVRELVDDQRQVIEKLGLGKRS